MKWAIANFLPSNCNANNEQLAPTPVVAPQPKYHALSNGTSPRILANIISGTALKLEKVEDPILVINGFTIVKKREVASGRKPATLSFVYSLTKIGIAQPTAFALTSFQTLQHHIQLTNRTLTSILRATRFPTWNKFLHETAFFEQSKKKIGQQEH